MFAKCYCIICTKGLIVVGRSRIYGQQKIKVLHIVWSKLGHYVTLTTTIRVPGEGRCTPLQHFPTSLVSEVTFYMGQGSAKTRALISRGARCGCAAAHLYFEGIMWEFLICWVSKIFIPKRYFCAPTLKILMRALAKIHIHLLKFGHTLPSQWKMQRYDFDVVLVYVYKKRYCIACS